MAPSKAPKPSVRAGGPAPAARKTAKRRSPIAKKKVRTPIEGPPARARRRTPPPLGIWFDRETGKKVAPPRQESGPWMIGPDELLLMALLCDTIYCAELLGKDPTNHEYAGMFKVRDYQYPLFRVDDSYAGFACGRSVGKTESVKWRAIKHVFKRLGLNLLLTAPELIHLLPLTDAVEDRIRSIRLLREFLRVEGGKTGFTHRPFGADFADGTKIVGRIPRLSGTGVKGQHQPDLIIDEAQDYPDAGWTEVHETVMKDTVDRDGNPDFHYHFYGVHSGARDSGFHSRMKSGGFKIVNVTAIQRPGWGREEKQAAIAAYGSTQAGDYRRNILGEAGGASSPFFNTARLMMCLEENRDGPYNATLIRPGMLVGPGGLHQLIRAEEFDELNMPIGEVLDLPDGDFLSVHCGADLGLRQSPTVFSIFAATKYKQGKGGTQERLQLIRRIHLSEMRTKDIRAAYYAIANFYGKKLRSFGSDITGLGFPIFQEMTDDEVCPKHLKDVHIGYFFNAKVPVHVEETNVTKDELTGRMKDHLGHAVMEVEDPDTNEVRYVTMMPMIEASTRYLREIVDSTYLLLPFDPEVTADMQGETVQRVNRIVGLKQKPNAFHILDSFRAMEMARRGSKVDEQLARSNEEPVMDIAVDLSRL